MEFFQDLVKTITSLDAKAKQGLGFMAATALLTIYSVKKSNEKRRRNITKRGNNASSNSSYDFDVLIVGAGPAGSTTAFYAAKEGLNVGLFDKKAFPRMKPCGDAWCAPALNLLEEMGILQKMEADEIVHPVKRGGFISPFGYQCINTDGDAYGSVTGCKTYAIKREIADEYIVRAANKIGAKLYEGYEILDAQHIANGDAKSGNGYWKVQVKAPNGETTSFTTKMLSISDGSTSYLAQKLGIIPQGSQPEAVSSTCYVSKNKWTEADGVMIFNKSMLPGYSALFKHYNGDLYFGTYILPGGKATSRSIAPFEKEAIEKYPYVNEAFGDEYEWVRKRMVAPIRLGGVPRAYSSQALLVGDSAGFVDPLTGEGIHLAMMGGKIAGQSLVEMFRANNFSEEACQAYELRTYDAFGYEFIYSSIAARVIYYLPISLDAVACVGKRRGQAFLDFFGEVMTGVKPKSAFMQPDLLIEITIELIKQIVLQYVFMKKPLVPMDIGQAVVNEQYGKKSGGFA